MKKVLIVSLIFCLVFIISCKAKKPVEFCEGMNPDGKGDKCGIKFESGEMTLIFTAKEPFETDSLTLIKKKLQGKHYEDYGTESCNVRPDDKKMVIPLALYQAGKYHIEIMKGDDRIGEGDVEIVDPAADLGFSQVRIE